MKREEWDKRYADAGMLWSVEPNGFLVEHIAEVPPGRALDLGCGEGRNALWLADRGWKTTAVDFSEVAIARGRQHGEQRNLDVEWVVEDLLEYVPAERAYDLVIDFYVHVPGPGRELIWQRAAAAVAPGGLLLVVGHHRANLGRGVGGPQSPDVLFTPEMVVENLTDLHALVAVDVTRAVETEEVTKEAIDALVLARRPA